MNPHIRAILLFIMFPTLACSQNKQGNLQPSRSNQTDLLITNAKIWTADPEYREAESILIRDGRFLYVGNEQDARARAKKNAHIIDAHGRRILPGLIDSHLHLIDGGLQLSRINLRDVPNREAFIESIKHRAAQTPKDQWIQGGRWSTESWPDPTQPNKEWIDAVTPDNPVLLTRMDGHGALANSVAFAKAGIDRNGPTDPIGGQIERDPATGEPTGILKDAAIDLVSKLIPKPTDTELDAGLEAAIKHANQHGITSVHTMSEYSHLAAFDRARNKGRLSLRIRQYISEDNWPLFGENAQQHKNDDWVRVCGFKGYSDGSLGSRTAYMSTPFSDNKADNGNWAGLPRELLSCESFIDKLCLAIRVSGLSLAIHAIGDQANHVILNCYERSSSEETKNEVQSLCEAFSDGPASKDILNHPKGPPPRIEHAQHLLPTDIPRFAQLGVVASMQPLHKADDARYAEKAIGPERCKTSYAFRSLLDAGALVAFGSDWPVVSLDPFLGVRAAVTGLSLDNKVFVPEQNITVEEALTCYTRSAARAAGDQASLGMIREGYLADFVILANDPLTTDPKNLREFRGDTYVAGKLVASTTANPQEPNKSASAYPASAEPDRTSQACHCCNRFEQLKPKLADAKVAKIETRRSE